MNSILKPYHNIQVFTLIFYLSFCWSLGFSAQLVGEKAPDNSFKIWHNIKFTFDQKQQGSQPINPQNYRLHTQFISPSGTIWKTPGFYSPVPLPEVTSPNPQKKWWTQFASDEVGVWSYHLALVSDKSISYNLQTDLIADTAHYEKGYFSIGSDEPLALAAPQKVMATYANNEIQIKGLSDKKHSIEIYDVMGVDIYHGDSSQKNKIALNTGLYFLEVVGEEFSGVIKLQIP